MPTSGQSTLASGVYAALATPRLHNSLEADAAALFDYLDKIMQAGVNGLVLFGTTGEFIHFDVSERMRVLTLARKRCRVPLLVNVSHSSLAGAIDLAQHAIEAHAAGLLLMPPYFFRYNEAQIFEFYWQFAAAIDSRTPLYLYNIPQFTNPLSGELCGRLLATGAFAGIKDSGGQWPLFEALAALHRERSFQWLVGTDSLYARAYAMGADGAVSGIAAAVPELLVCLHLALKQGSRDRVDLLGVRLREFIAWLDKFPATFAIRQAAAERGWKFDRSAVPLDRESAQTLEEFRRWFGAWLPLVLAECKA
jgi:4-hydroxy-tetrahydrodipicolinate synthase